MNIKEQFGSKIRQIRQKHKISQEALAEALEIQPQSLSSIENGKSFVSYRTLTKLCQFFNCTPKDFFDFNYIEISTDSEIAIKEINDILPELNSEKLYYLYNMARIFAGKE